MLHMCQCLAASIFDVWRISAKKDSGIVGLLGYCVYMCIPSQCVADQDSHVLCIDMSE